MIGKLTDEELAALPEKQQRNLRVQPKVLALYRENEFLDAYAAHTDFRIFENGYQAAVGAGDNWEQHGTLQFDFLVSQGLLPQHTLLDVGCGTGRLARKVVPYLNENNYTGCDISSGALDALLKLAQEEGWAKRYATLVRGDLPDAIGLFDFAWAYSVFIHLPMEVVQDVLNRVALCLKPTGQFLFSFSPEKTSWRSGLKQFRHTRKDYKTAAYAAGLTFETMEDWVAQAGHTSGRWSGGMHVARVRRKA